MTHDLLVLLESTIVHDEELLDDRILYLEYLELEKKLSAFVNTGDNSEKKHERCDTDAGASFCLMQTFCFSRKRFALCNLTFFVSPVN
jgi:hypothetical protein